MDDVLRELTSRYPDLRKQLFAEDGRLRKFVNVYVNDEDIRYLENENTPVKAGRHHVDHSICSRRLHRVASTKSRAVIGVSKWQRSLARKPRP